MENTESPALYGALTSRLEQIKETDLIRPNCEPLKSVKILGEATPMMKRLYTLLTQLEKQGKLGEDETLRRGAIVALAYEVGVRFQFGIHFGIDSLWQVFCPPDTTEK